MNTRNLAIAVFTTLACIGVQETVAHAAVNAKRPDPAPPIQWPESPCNLENRMNIAVVDGLLFECTCVRLYVNYQCDWMIIAGVDETPAEARRLKVKRHHAKGWRIAAPALSRVAA